MCHTAFNTVYMDGLVQFNVRKPAAKCGAADLPARELQTICQ